MIPAVDILILNWNSWRDTLICLESVFRSDYGRYRAVVIDNGSTDGSVERIREWAAGPGAATVDVLDRTAAEQGSDIGPDHAGRHVVIIETGRNLGFAGGNNVGIRHALRRNADYVLLLNNDAFFRTPDTLATMISFMERTPRAGACGGRMVFPDGKPQQSYGNFPTVLRALAALFPAYRLLPASWLPAARRSCVVPEGNQLEPARVDWPSGACLLVRRRAIDEVGLLDEAFFLYLEETDWCLRMDRAGWERYFVPQAEIGHAFGGTVNRTALSMRRYHLDSQFVYLGKHFRRSEQAMVALGYLVRGAFSWSGRAIAAALAPGTAVHRTERDYWQAALRGGMSALSRAFAGSDSSGGKGLGRA